MTEDFALQSLRYLLEQMTPAERKAFDKLLDTDSAACALFKNYADALASHTAQEAADTATLSEQEAALVLGRLQYEAIPALSADTPKPRKLQAWLWPAAALLLLALNLWQFLRPTRPTPSNPPSQTEQGPLLRNNQTANLQQGYSAPAFGPAGGRSKQQNPSLDHLQEEKERLSEDCAALREERDNLTNEAQRLARSLRTLTLTSASGTKLLAMEMVDPANYANGQRRGLFDAARKVLASQGTITPPSPSTQGSGTDNQTGTFSSSVSNTLATTNGATTSITVGTDLTGVTTLTHPPAPTADPTTVSDTPNLLLGTVSAPTTSETAPATLPYAWTIFDGSSNQGSINLYNLPNPGSGEALVLWTKSEVPGSSYVRVGSLPDALSGKSGNILFRTPDGSIPTEILISREPKAAPSATPTGPIVLHGP